MSIISESHTAACDLEGCVNYGRSVDILTISGQAPNVHCVGCDRDISHTATPKE